MKQQSKKYITDEEAIKAYYLSMESMATLNINAARLMKKYNSHGATDITGFGILGHAQNLATAQFDDVDITIHSLPIINKMELINNNILNFKLLQGYSAETSGGLFLMLEKSIVKDYMRELKEVYGQESWEVGQVTKGSKKATIREDVQVINVKESFLQD